MSKRILFVVPAGIEWASSRFRAYWPAMYMDAAEVVTAKEFDALVDTPGPAQFDAVVFVKQSIVGRGEQAARLLSEGRQVWWDLCDPLHWTSPSTVLPYMEHVTGVTCSNEGLADDLHRWLEDGYEDMPVHTIPDRLHLPHYHTQRKHHGARPLRLIWYGLGANRVALHGAALTLNRYVAEEGQGSLTLTIMDDLPAVDWSGLFACPVAHVRWSLEREVEVIAGHDVAVLPPYPGPWGTMKSNNKQLTAWACGLPTVTGHNYDGLLRMMASAEVRQREANGNWLCVERDYDVALSAREWQCLIDQHS